VLEALDVGQRPAVDLVEAPQVAGQRVRLALDAVAAQIFEKIVVRMNPVKGGRRGMRFVKVSKEIVDEVG